MSFPFRYIGDLLESLDDALQSPERQRISSHVLVANWFQLHRQRLDAFDANACAILSTLLPDRRTDRVFFIQSTKLEGIIGQALTLGASRVKELRRYREPGLGIDLADCVQLLLTATPNTLHADDVTVEAIDAILGEVASRCKWSSPAVRDARQHGCDWSAHEALGDIYLRLSPRDAKWFTRLVLKDYQAVALDHNLVLRNYHPLLPQMLKVRDDLGLTTAFLRHAKQSQDDLGRINSILKPKLGVKVGRQNWPHDYEQLMIVYFDVLMIDKESMLPVKHCDRRKRLEALVTCRPGIAELVAHETIPFSRSTAPAQLRRAFATCIVNREEGLVLKPDEPYFDFSASYKPHSSGNIKLKKEYVQGWGDVGDFAVIGASYDAVKAKTYPSPPPRWTHFYIACLRNRVQVLARNERPRFRHVNVVELNNTLMHSFQTHCRPEEIAFEENNIFDIDRTGFGESKAPTVLFSEPLVFDMRCFSFDKSSNTNFWSMRFPLVSKVHFDRSYLDTVSFEDLQRIAEESRAAMTHDHHYHRDQQKRQEREWVAVYDWRVLEILTDIEMGKMPAPKDDVWRRFWVGLA
ncbi:hypothetical protein Micbo1qcDRAFT_202905 [Microdochium bolleyi]|uniref:ATP-dependent DNA ligase family profile domain-containing protein n=1 Tax=Microdochium bolleyi TaxID=196109 RepID=A0A136J6E4_9PEZI|nr:hypothetical protein Micbo1qcDRAFT_202905 [Microdochium bolleyi]